MRAVKPVFLDTDVDMTQIRAHQSAAREHGRRYSTVSYVLHAAARVLKAHPAANTALRGHLRPRMAWYDSVNGKLTLDKTLGGQRIVVSTVLRDLHRAGLDAIQRQVDHFKDGDPATMPEFGPMRTLQRLPQPLGRLAFRLGVRPLAGRAEKMGTFAVTSLGHRPVDGFYSVGGATVTLGVGRTADRPVVRDGAVTVAPVMRLSLTFDHRAIDGAEAADVLADLKDGLEARRESGEGEQ
ncbi:2-oxo acid dehydrogenase subunit E2 [Streptomyces sp. NPDC001920]